MIDGTESGAWDSVLFCSSDHADLHLTPLQEGFTKLWTGLGPNVARNAIINAAELASYDQVKQVKCILSFVSP